MPRLIAFAFALTLLLTASGAAVAHDEDCASRLLAAQVEEVDRADGWEWEELTPVPSGGWSGEFGPDTDAPRFVIACSPDPAGHFDAVARAERLGLGYDVARVASVPVGDQSEAVRRDFDDFSIVVLRWYRGPVSATVTAGGDEDWAKVEAFALALDELLAATLE